VKPVAPEPGPARWLVRIIDRLERHWLLFSLGVLGLAALGVVVGRSIPLQDNPETYLAKRDPKVLALQRFHEYFGGNRVLAVTVEVPGGVLTPKGIRELEATTRALADLPAVYRVASLVTLELQTPDGDALRVGRLFPRLPATPSDLRVAKRRLESHPDLRRTFLSADGRVTTYVASLGVVDGPWRHEERAALLADVEQALRAVGVWSRARLIGADPVVERTRELLSRDRSITTAVGNTVAFLVLLLLLRDLVAVAIVGLAPLTAMGLTFGVLYLSGRPITLIGGVLMTLVSVYTLGDALHVFYHLQTVKARGRKYAGAAVRDILPACTFTSLTTAIGFGSLAWSDVWPVRDFGIMAAIGVTIAFFVDVVLLPVLLRHPRVRARLERRDASSEGRWARRIAERLGRFALRKPLIVFLGTAALLAAGAPGIHRLYLDSNFLHELSPTDPVRESIAFHDRHLVGALPAEFLIEAQEPGAFRSPEVLRKLLRIQSEIDRRPELSRSTSIANLVLASARAIASPGSVARIPDDPGEVAELLLLASFSRGGLSVGSFLTPDARVARISCRTSFVDAGDAGKAEDRIVRRARKLLGPRFHVDVTGIGPILGGSYFGLFEGFRRSFWTALVLVSLIFLWLTRSLWWTLLALVVNLFPILLTYAVLGWWKQELWINGLSFGAVAFGIAVDDTLHVLASIAREGGQPVAGTVYRALRRSGPGVVTTSLALAAGFGSACTSDFPGTSVFGALLVLAMGFALLADLLLLPALISVLPLRPLLRFGWLTDAGRAGASPSPELEKPRRPDGPSCGE